jgi:hypothetical protein
VVGYSHLHAPVLGVGGDLIRRKAERLANISFRGIPRSAGSSSQLSELPENRVCVPDGHTSGWTSTARYADRGLFAATVDLDGRVERFSVHLDCVFVGAFLAGEHASTSQSALREIVIELIFVEG